MASWHPGSCLPAALTGWLLSLLGKKNCVREILCLSRCQVPLPPGLLSAPLAVRVGDSVSLPVPFPLPPFQIQTTIIWRKNTTIVAMGALHPNFSVVVAPSFRPQFSVDPLRGNLTIAAMTARTSGIYTVEIFPLGSSGRKEDVAVQAYEEVGDVSVSPPHAEATEGDGMVALNCTPVRGSVSWTRDGQALGENPRYLRSAGYLQIGSPQRTDTGVYRCTVSNPFGNGTGVANLTVYYGPETPTIAVSPVDQGSDAGSFVLVNSTVSLACRAPSEPPAKIYWNVADAEDLDVPSLPTLRLPRVQLSQAGPYSCLAINQRTQKRVRNTVSLRVAQQPAGSPLCSVTSAEDGTALLFLCSWPGGSPAPHLNFRGLPGDSRGVSAPRLQELLAPPFPAGLSGKTITCLGGHLTGQGNCSVTAEAPLGVSLSFQTHDPGNGSVTVELHCQGTFNPVEVEWFREQQSLSPTSGRYQLSPDGTHFTIWNFTVPQDLGEYRATCSNPLGSQQSNLTVTGPSISNWTLSRGPHPGSAYLEWTIPKGSVVTSFWIQMQSSKQSRSGEEWKTVEILAAANRATTVMGLQPQAPYSFQIVPRLGSQAGNASQVLILQPPGANLSGGAIAGIVIGSIFGMLLVVALLLLLIWLTCRQRAQNKKVPLENQQHYLSRQFPNGNTLEPNDPSWRNSCWSSGDSDIYAITYEKHLYKYGAPTSLPVSSVDSGHPLPAPQRGPRNVRSATQV